MTEKPRTGSVRPMPLMIVAMVLVIATTALVSRLTPHSRSGTPRPGENPRGPALPGSALTLARVFKSSVDSSDRIEGIGTVMGISSDRTRLQLSSGGKTTLLQVREPIETNIKTGDVLTYRGEKTGGTRFGGLYLRGTFIKTSGKDEDP